MHASMTMSSAMKWLFSLATFTLAIISVQSSLLDGFDCPPLRPLDRPARNVHELRPQDIKVIMALGDSVTAGFAMMGRHLDPIEDSYEYRGNSWSMGGDDDAVTIAKFLRYYNPGLIGASVGEHIVELCYGVLCPPLQYYPEKDVFNAAQSGAMLPDLVTHEFAYLVEQLKKHPEVDFENDWKLMTILAGFNDLCLGCSGDYPTITADDFEKNIMKILQEISGEIPRVFVNLVEVFNISQIYTVSKQSEYCVTFHDILPIECECVFAEGERGEKKRQEADILGTQYNQRMRKVAEYFQKQKNDYFAVVVQPGFRDGSSKNGFPLNFVSDLDCFHPSLLGQQKMAKVIWNNMLTPAAQKKTTFPYNDPFICPTNETLLYTY